MTTEKLNSWLEWTTPHPNGEHVIVLRSDFRELIAAVNQLIRVRELKIHKGSHGPWTTIELPSPLDESTHFDTLGEAIDALDKEKEGK